MRIFGALLCLALSLMMLLHAFHRFQFDRLISAVYLFVSLLMAACAVVLILSRPRKDQDDLSPEP
ncbi:MAG: hypothetical protein KF774_15610 [Planctomyces sp.]|nr:hypothetical protein [Planctomyces sp.]